MHIYTWCTHKHTLKCCTVYKLSEGENSPFSYAESHLIEMQNSNSHGFFKSGVWSNNIYLNGNFIHAFCVNCTSSWRARQSSSKKKSINWNCIINQAKRIQVWITALHHQRLHILTSRRTFLNSFYFSATLAEWLYRCAVSVCVSATWNISTTTWWIAIIFCSDIHGAQTMNPLVVCWLFFS